VIPRTKIVFLNPAGELGGAERCLLDLIASMLQALPEIEIVLVAGADGPLVTEARALGIGVELMPLPEALASLGDSALRGRGRVRSLLQLLPRAIPAGLATLAYARDTKRLLRRLEPTLIHSNGNKTHLLACFTRPAKVPVVWHVRDFVGTRRLMARLLRLVSSRASGVVAISDAVARDVSRIVSGVPVARIYDAIDLREFSPGPGDGAGLDVLAGLPTASAGTLRVGLIATYARWKGHLVFLEAAARVLATGGSPPLRFYIVGGPIYATGGSQFSEQELRSAAERLGIAAHVGFVGFRKDVANVFRALDIAVHASTQPEPFGRTIVEAMACARPVIVARAGGAAELFTHGVDGLGCTPGSVEELAGAVSLLAADAGLRSALADAARAHAAARFSRVRIGPEVLAAYGRFTACRVAPAGPAPRSGLGTTR